MIGIAAGMAGGYLLAKALVGTVAETISSLYVLLSVQQIVVAPWIWISALLLGLASVLAAAWLPARQAAAMDPVQALHGRTRIEQAVHLSRGWIFAGLFSLLLSLLLSLLALRTGPPLAWLRCGVFCPGRLLSCRAGIHGAFQPRHEINRSQEHRASARRSKSRARTAAQFGHDRVARRGRGDDRGRGRNDLFLSPNRRRLDRPDAHRRPVHFTRCERDRRTKFVHPADRHALSGTEPRRRSSRYFPRGRPAISRSNNFGGGHSRQQPPQPPLSARAE